MLLRLLAALVTLLLISGCATQPKPVQDKPSIQTIAIISATTPATYTLENVSAVQFLIPLAATANYLDSKEKAKTFNEKFGPQASPLGARFTEDVAKSLRAYGYDVKILNDVSRTAAEPDKVDHKSVLTSADAVLHLRFTNIGLFSSRSSSDYVPRVNALGQLFVNTKGKATYLYDEDMYYGADAKNGRSSSIIADARFAYPSFAAVMDSIDGVRQAFETGASEISQRMSMQIHNAIK